MDNLSNAARSENMRRIRSRDTLPEVAVRSLIHRMGFRFRIHRNDLPGCPDIVLVRQQKIIFVHGCFWHQHPGCAEGRLPETRQEYWVPKFQRNKDRDVQNRAELRKLGWRSLVVWECELKRPRQMEKKLMRFLCG
jgi:DNA mismatch endonuclease (patch repair protein)